MYFAYLFFRAVYGAFFSICLTFKMPRISTIPKFESCNFVVNQKHNYHFFSCWIMSIMTNPYAQHIAEGLRSYPLIFPNSIVGLIQGFLVSAFDSYNNFQYYCPTSSEFYVTIHIFYLYIELCWIWRCEYHNLYRGVEWNISTCFRTILTD